MKVIKYGGTIWGNQLAEFVREEGFSEPILYEIGAFDGRDIDIFLEVLPKTEAFAFEADPYTYNTYLKRKPYKTFPVAIGDKNGMAFFYQYNNVQTNSLYERVDGQSHKRIEVPIYRLEDFVKKNHLSYPDIVKIDTEGATLDILEGMGDMLNRVSILYLETENEPIWERQKLHDDVVRFLESQFECAVLHDNDNQSDSLWIRK